MRVSVALSALGVEGGEILIDGGGENVDCAICSRADMLYRRLDMMVVAVGEED